MAYPTTHLLTACFVLATAFGANAQTQGTAPMAPQDVQAGAIEPGFQPGLLPAPHDTAPVLPVSDTPPVVPDAPQWSGMAPDTAVSSPPNPGMDALEPSEMPGSAVGEPPLDQMVTEPNPGMVDPNPGMPLLVAGCALENAQAVIGMAWDESLLEGIQAPGAVRVLRPGDAATMDFSQTRLNIVLDGSGKVVEATCG